MVLQTRDTTQLTIVIEGKYSIHSDNENAATSVESNTQTNTSNDVDSGILIQETFDNCIRDYFIHSNIPLHHINDSSFKNMFSVLCIDRLGLNIMSDTSLVNHISDLYFKVRTDIKTQLKDIKHLCIHSVPFCVRIGGKASLGALICNWISSDLKRKSCVLACLPYQYVNIRGMHNLPYGYGNIWNSQDLEAEAGVNLFKKLLGEENYSISKSNLNRNTTTLIESGFQVYDGVVMLCDIMTTKNKMYLQLHSRCVVPVKSIDQTDVRKVIRQCRQLCEALEDPYSAKVVQNMFGHPIARPPSSHYELVWYDDLRHVLSIQDKYIQIHTALQLKDPLKEQDFVLMNEHVKCFKPIVDATNLLQDKGFYGITLPCLLSIRKKLIRLSNDDYTFCKDVPAEYLKKLDSQFTDLFNLSTDIAVNTAIAAVSYPRFKYKWLACIDYQLHDKIKEAFLGAVVEELSASAERSRDTANFSENNSLFDFDDDFNHEDLKIKAEVLVTRYLHDKESDVSMLYRHKEIKEVFMKYNTPLPMLPLIEEMHIYETMRSIQDAVQCDEILEKILVIKYWNNDLTKISMK